MSDRAPKTVPLFETRGDTFTLNIVVVNSSNVAVDITDWTFYLTIKSKLADSDVNAAIQKIVTSHTNPTGGITVISLTPAETDELLGMYVYDVQWKDDSGNVETLLNGNITFDEDVTRTGS